MADWQNKVVLSDLVQKYEKDEFTIEELGKAVGNRLETLKPIKVPSGCDKEDLESQLNDIIGDIEMVYEEEEFDYQLGQLYNWGDISLDGRFSGKKLCWIEVQP